MRRISLQLLGFAIAALPSFAPAAPAPEAAPEAARRPELVAATEDAMESLRRAVMAAPLTSELTVRQFVDHIGGGEVVLTRIEHDAEQRGGTRWRNDRTCEVRMEVAGADVADAVGKVAADRQNQLAALNLRPESIHIALDELRLRTFSALGRSTGAGSIDHVRPPAGADAWAAVPEKDRLQAVSAAKAMAVARVLESLSTLDLGGGKSMADALEIPAFRDELHRWLAGRPVTKFVFGDDLNVRLTLAAPPEEFWPVVQSALLRSKLGPPADDAKAWSTLRKQFLEDMAPANGRGTAAQAIAAVAPARAAMLPNAPPRWVTDQMNADGSAPGYGLRAARAAEAAALSQLRVQLEALPLAEGTTVGRAANADPRIARALSDVIRRTPTTKISYGQGSVAARVGLDLIGLWRELEAER